MTRALSLAGALCVFLAACGRTPTVRESFVEVCHFALDDRIRDLDMDEQLVATFTVRNGEPADIQVTRDRMRIGSAVNDCLSRWRVGFIDDGAGVTATFQWRHGIGWRALELSWSSNHVRLALSGQLDPYHSRAVIPADRGGESPRDRVQVPLRGK